MTTSTATRAPEQPATAPARGERAPVWLAIARILLGWVFLWAFLDKLAGLGISTPPAEAWTAGVSPTEGYLASLEGTFAAPFQAIAGQAWVDWAYMLGMLLVGSALMLGVAMRPAAVGAIGLMAALWLTSVPLEHNPLVDEHVMYAVLAVVLAVTGAGNRLGAGRAWAALPVVRRHAWLR